MILLSAAKMPKGLDKNTLADTVSLLFSHRDNTEYLELIRQRKNDESACESLFALALLYELIFSLPATVDPSKLIFARSDMGKPYFVNSDLKFNLSHSKGYVAVACSIGEELGVDVEASDLPKDRALKMAERYFSAEETAKIISSPKDFAKIWSEKEAKAKFRGESVGNILSKEQNSDNSDKNDSICIHRYSIDGFPITLCTKRDFSTIIFTVQ